MYVKIENIMVYIYMLYGEEYKVMVHSVHPMDNSWSVGCVNWSTDS